jgi:hypothetical protein
VLFLAALSELVTGAGHGAQPAQGNLREETLAAIDNWSSSSGIVMTDPAKAQILAEVQKAREAVRNRNTGIELHKIDQVIPGAVVSFLGRSQGNRRLAPLEVFIEEQLQVSNGLVLPTFSDVPTLVVAVTPSTPPDFVVIIDDVPFSAGSSKFRVTEGRTSIRVTRAGKTPCVRQIEVTTSGPNTVSCSL